MGLTLILSHRGHSEEAYHLSFPKPTGYEVSLTLFFSLPFQLPASSLTLLFSSVSLYFSLLLSLPLLPRSYKRHLLDQFYNFSILDRFLKSPLRLSSQTAFAIDTHTADALMRKYYQVGVRVVCESVCVCVWCVCVCVCVQLYMNELT